MMLRLLENKNALILHIKQALHGRIQRQQIFPLDDIDWKTAAGVLMLLGSKPGATRSDDQPCIILNKRSMKVKQPGDLCFPGGSIAPSIDPYLARFFTLPVTSLGIWQHSAAWKKNHSHSGEMI